MGQPEHQQLAADQDAVRGDVPWCLLSVPLRCLLTHRQELRLYEDHPQQSPHLQPGELSQ